MAVERNLELAVTMAAVPVGRFVTGLALEAEQVVIDRAAA